MLAVAAELDKAWALVDQGAVGQGLGAGFYPVQHVGGFTGIDRPLAVRADGHAFRLDADIDLGQDLEVSVSITVTRASSSLETYSQRLLGCRANCSSLPTAAWMILRVAIAHLDLVRVAGADVSWIS